jgi:hypothetical protein
MQVGCAHSSGQHQAASQKHLMLGEVGTIEFLLLECTHLTGLVVVAVVSASGLWSHLVPLCCVVPVHGMSGVLVATHQHDTN